jgi:hypothetical protein
MNLTELLSIEPKAAAYELKRGGKYLICTDRRLSPETIHHFQQKLQKIGEHHGIEFVGLIDFIPRIFELEQEKEKL